jgi:glycosyltransferase involved in cell wall biosynthesis
VTPTISVIVPSFNRASSLPRVIEAWLKQAGDLELIVVNDGSSDETRDVLDGVRDVRLRAIHQENAGPAVARNRGLEAARGRYVLFSDDDIVPEPGFVRAHLDALGQFPGDAVVSRVRVPEAVVQTPFQRYWRDRMHTGSDRLRSGRIMGWGGFWFVSLSIARDRLPKPAFSSAFGYGWEDHELGWRLWRAGVRPRFCAQAQAAHEDAVSLEGIMTKWRTLGRSAWTFVRAHPNLTVWAWTGTLPLAVGIKRALYPWIRAERLLETRTAWEGGPLAARRYAFLLEASYTRGLLEGQGEVAPVGIGRLEP